MMFGNGFRDYELVGLTHTQFPTTKTLGAFNDTRGYAEISQANPSNSWIPQLDN